MAISNDIKKNAFDNLEELQKSLEEKTQNGIISNKQLEHLKVKMQEVRQEISRSGATTDTLNGKINELNKSLEKTEKSLAAGFKSLENAANAANTISNKFENLVGMVSSFRGVSNELLGAWEKVDDASSKFTKEIGGSAYAMRELRKSTIDFAEVNKIGIRFNKSMEELIKLQSEYSKEVGRSVSLTNAQKETMAAMGALLGDQQATKLAASFEKFGLNFEEAGKRTAKMFQEASKHGVNASVMTQNVANNIGLASKYSFTNGIKGLTEMALKATSLRLDMQQAANMAEKVNNVEGAATASASLSVLGGSIAAGANPLSMMYEGLNDLEGLQDRIVNMFGNLGKMNYQTGEVEIGAFDKQRMRAAAQAAGLDYGNLLDMTQTKAKKNAIQKMTGGRWSGDEAFEDMITNAATIKDGRAFVNINGKDIDVADINKEDEGALRKATQGVPDDVKDIAQNVRSLADMKEGFQKQLDVTKARHTEFLGFGDMAKKGLDFLGRSTNALEAIRIAVLGGVMFAGLGGSIRNLNSFLSGKGKTANLGRMSTSARNNPPVAPGGVPMGGPVVGSKGGGTPGKIGSGGNNIVGKNPPVSGSGSGVNQQPAPQQQQQTKINPRSFRYQGNGIASNGFGQSVPVNTPFTRNGRTYMFKIDKNTGHMQTFNTTGGKNVAIKNSQGVALWNNPGRGARFKNFMKGGVSAGTIAGGMAASMASGAVDSWHQSMLSDGTMKKSNVAGNAAMGAASYGLQGAAMGSIFGVPGMLIGGAIGAIYGGFSAANDAKKQGILEKLSKRGYYLNGDYSLGELETIQKGRGAILGNLELFKKMQANGDELPEDKFASGGVVVGRGHGTSDKVHALLSNGEYVVKKSAVDRLGKGVLDKVNSGNVTPVKVPNGGSINSMKVRPNMEMSGTMKHSHSGEIKHSAIQIQFPNGMSKQVTDEVTQNLLQNPQFMNEIGKKSQIFSNKVLNRGRNNEEMRQTYGFS